MGVCPISFRICLTTCSAAVDWAISTQSSTPEQPAHTRHDFAKSPSPHTILPEILIESPTEVICYHPPPQIRTVFSLGSADIAARTPIDTCRSKRTRKLVADILTRDKRLSC